MLVARLVKKPCRRVWRVKFVMRLLWLWRRGVGVGESIWWSVGSGICPCLYWEIGGMGEVAFFGYSQLISGWFLVKCAGYNNVVWYCPIVENFLGCKSPGCVSVQIPDVNSMFLFRLLFWTEVSDVLMCCKMLPKGIWMVTNRLRRGSTAERGGLALVGFTLRKVPIFHQHHESTLSLDIA